MIIPGEQAVCSSDYRSDCLLDVSREVAILFLPLWWEKAA
jgi:hypothetical protein